MNIKSYAKSAVALAVLTGAAVSAHAANYLLTVAVGGAPTSFNASHAGVGLSTFDDNFVFSLGSAGITGGSVIEFSIPTVVGASFTGASLFSGTPGSGTLVAAATGTTTSMSFASAVTPAGSYYFNVAGIVPLGLSHGAAYNGSISVAAAPVPEPESYAMLLAGLGMMGAIAVRRNKSKKKD